MHFNKKYFDLVQVLISMNCMVCDVDIKSM